MKTLAETAARIETWLQSLTRDEITRLDQRMSHLSAEQVRFVFKVLTDACTQDFAPKAELSRIEQCFETWWEQSLAQRLAILECITDLGSITADLSRQVLLPGSQMLQGGAPWLAGGTCTANISCGAIS